jgi:DNA-binding winged helix-turn-helix (wHTH) protein
MNGRSQQQLSTERRGYINNTLEQDCDRRNQADGGLETFAFGAFRVIPHARLLEYRGVPVSLGSRAFDLLCLLVSRPGEVVRKDELMAKAWPDVTVEESSLRFHITQLRRALDDSQGGERYVVNIPGRGYCFVACVDREASRLKLDRDGHTRMVEAQLAAN